jgi:hypothetical protein
LGNFTEICIAPGLRGLDLLQQLMNVTAEVYIIHDPRAIPSKRRQPLISVRARPICAPGQVSVPLDPDAAHQPPTQLVNMAVVGGHVNHLPSITNRRFKVGA